MLFGLLWREAPGGQNPEFFGCDIAGNLYLGSNDRWHRKRKAPHISDICLPGKHKQEHTHCFSGAGRGDSQVTQLQRELSIQMPGIQAQLPRRLGFNEDCGFRMKAGAGRLSALGNRTVDLSALPESHGRWGTFALFRWSAPVPVTRGTARILRGQWGF